MTDEQKRDQYEIRAFFAQFRRWETIMVALTLGATVLAITVALVMLIPSRN
jgi:negative regulator of sigma E activity